jgi:hypothetical protein
MLQRALPLQHPHIALGQELAAHAPSRARALVRAFAGHFQRIMRLVGQYAAAGGALS